jgi:hypothetical protein
MSQCPAHHTSINYAAQMLTEACAANEIKGYDGINSGGLSYAIFAVERGRLR